MVATKNNIYFNHLSMVCDWVIVSRVSYAASQKEKSQINMPSLSISFNQTA